MESAEFIFFSWQFIAVIQNENLLSSAVCFVTCKVVDSIHKDSRFNKDYYWAKKSKHAVIKQPEIILDMLKYIFCSSTVN